MDNLTTYITTPTASQWYSEDFIFTSVVKFLKENGYKIQKEIPIKDGGKSDKIINATKFFKREIIEIKGFPYCESNDTIHLPVKASQHAKSWFSDALVNSFYNFGTFENAEVAMALPNIGRYQAIVEKLHDYFTINDLYFRIYLVNEDGSIEVSNLNEKYIN